MVGAVRGRTCARRTRPRGAGVCLAWLVAERRQPEPGGLRRRPHRHGAAHDVQNPLGALRAHGAALRAGAPALPGHDAAAAAGSLAQRVSAQSQGLVLQGQCLAGAKARKCKCKACTELIASGTRRCRSCCVPAKAKKRITCRLTACYPLSGREYSQNMNFIRDFEKIIIYFHC